MPFLNQLLYRTCNILYGDVQVNTMLVEQIDRIDLQSLQRPLCDLFDVFWPTVESVPLAAVIGIGFPAELRCDHYPTTERSKSFTHKFFIGERTVNFGGVEECDATLDYGLY